MPVQAGDFDNLITLVIVVALTYLVRNPQQVNHPASYVEAVEAGNHKEHRAELRGAVGVTPGPNALVYNELCPLEGLHANE